MKGSTYCMVKLANRNQKHRICFDGTSIIDEEEEFHWLNRAAELGYAPSYIPLGLRYQCGSGTEQSKDKAEFWYNNAKDAGIETSMDYLMDIWQQKWSEKTMKLRCKIDVYLVKDLIDKDGNMVPATDIIESMLWKSLNLLRCQKNSMNTCRSSVPMASYIHWTRCEKILLFYMSN